MVNKPKNLTFFVRKSRFLITKKSFPASEVAARRNILRSPFAAPAYPKPSDPGPPTHN